MHVPLDLPVLKHDEWNVQELAQLQVTWSQSFINYTDKSECIHLYKCDDLTTKSSSEAILVRVKYYQTYSNDEPGLTLIYFIPRSNLVPFAFVWENS